MPRIVAFEHRNGAMVKIDGHTFSIAQHARGSGVLTLSPQDGGPPISISTSELAALIVQERAEYTDGVFDPDPEPVREFTDITNLSPHRAIDWFCKIYLVRMMHSSIGQSPKSQHFAQEYSDACSSLTAYLELGGVSGFIPWSIWTFYHDLLRFQASRFEIASIQKKGVEYCGYKVGSSIFAEAAILAKEVLLDAPHVSAKVVTKKVNAIIMERRK